MQMIYNKKRKLNKLKVSLLTLVMVLFAGVATAQTRANEIRMKTGTVEITDQVRYNFYDSGGPNIYSPEQDPNNDYNWASMYQHNESYLLHFSNPHASKGIQITFNSLLINNDHLKVYEGDLENEDNLIVDLTNADYSTGYGNQFTVMSHGNMTIRFQSDGQYRDLGWDAYVQLSNYTPAAPVALMEACESNIVLLPGSMGTTSTKMYYTTDGTPPSINATTGDILNGTEYTGPFAITQATTVKAILVENDNSSSTVSTYVFNSLITPPDPPTITRVDGTNDFEIDAHWTTGNDTYYIQYTTDGSDPQFAPSSQHLICSYRDENGTYQNKINTVSMNQIGQLRVVTRGTVCPDIFSEESNVDVEQIFVPTPEISVSGTGATGTAEITCSLPGATIYYTLDGTDPTTSTTTYGTSPITLNTVPAGATIKAMAAHSGTGYENSAIATAMYIPGGQGGQGVYGSVVLLDDREDHSWSYYSDKTNPIRSLNPADVKITYFGNGTNNISTTNGATPGNNSWTQSATTVQVSYNEAANQFVYLKTLERADGATSENPTGNCAYTTIPNPFSKRPTYQYATGDLNKYCGFYGWRVKAVRGGSIQNQAVGSVINAETEIQLIPAGEYGMEVELEALWARAYVVTTGGGNSNTAIGNNSVGYERNFVVLAQNQNYYFGGNTNPRISETGRSATISRRYPDGTLGNANATVRPVSSGGWNASYSITLGADTKFEYMAFYDNNNFTLTAAGNDLIIGRGVSGTVNYVRGAGGDLTAPNYHIRLESGTFNYVSMLRGYWSGANTQNDNTQSTFSGNLNLKATIGSDYDRAANETSGPDITRNMIMGTNQNISATANRTRKTLDVIIKSGKIGSYHTMNNNFIADAYQSLYMSSASSQTNVGERCLTIEGGEISSVAGGIDNNNQGQNNNHVRSLTVRMKGGTIRGAFYGGAAKSPASGDRNMVFTGGTVKSWLGAGCNGTDDDGGQTYGASYLYVGGKTYVGGGTNVNSSEPGTVFGAGKGYAGGSGTSGEMTYGTTVVIADETVIENDVYGGGNYGYALVQTDLYILGGTIQNNAFGGSNRKQGNVINVYMKDGVVQGNVYGGSNTTGTISGLATINVSGGTVTNVFGGGYGTGTNMANNTIVNVSGGTINNNVYGGGALGTVAGNTTVSVSGGTMNNIFGAGQGRAAATGVTAVTANIGGTTTVNVSGGTIAESVYGGGEIGNVKQANNPTGSKDGEEGGDRAITAVSTVNVTGGNIASNVFGGGRMGFTNGGTVVNMSGGNVEGSVFAGAFGTQGRVYVAGQRTLNMRGGTVNKNVYGGSRNADDALSFNPGAFASSQETATASVVNYAGGYVHYQVFASGYFGNVFGSTYAFVGTNAILNAPYHVAPSGDYDETFYNQHQALRIGGSVWAGGDFGNYDGSKFGDPTISGRSNVYVDGLGYDTESSSSTNTNYMYIGGSIYGSGTSCDAGKQGRHIIVREYGHIINATQPTVALPYSSATRALYSIQRADYLDIDNSHIVLLGEGKINSLVTTEKYTIHEFNEVRISNGSSIFLNYPADQMKKFGSYKVNDVYDESPTYTKVSYETTSLEETPNKIRVSNGAYLQIKYVDSQNNEQYGELEGFAYMMSDDANNTCAYARPKQSSENGNIIPDAYDNPNDGGWVSYDENLNDYTIDGAPASQSDQMRYENHTVNLRNGEQYFRIWRAGGTVSYREGVFVAQSDGTSNYSTVDVHISLPAFENEDDCGENAKSFYRIKSLDGNTLIDYGTDVMTVNAACYGDVDEANWMYINGNTETASFVTDQEQGGCSNLHYIADAPNVNFGLVAIPGGGLADNDNMLICEASDRKLATMQWENNHNEAMPEVTFRLTYNNNLTNNVVWDPMTITFEQVSCDGTTVLATVDVALTVTTLTNIEQDFVTQAYAIARGKGTATDSYTAKVVLPQYVMHVNNVGEISKWTCTNVEWIPKSSAYEGSFVISTGENNYLNPHPDTDPCNNKFAMTLVAGLNFDNTTGWDEYEVGPKDMYNYNDPSYVFGSTTARDPIGFDFTMLYDGRQTASDNYQIGDLEFTMHFTNYEGASSGEPAYEKDLKIKIEVWFLGTGANYYIDGVHGDNLYSGKYPNAAKKTLSGIYNRTDYHAGDYIFVVDAVTANSNSALVWNGKAYDEVTIYRYPGGHQCVANVQGAESHYEDYDIENNACYAGPLVIVEKDMEMTGIVLDGFYDESQKEVGEAAGDRTVEGVNYFHTYEPAGAPLVEIKNGGKLSVYGSSCIQNNYNSSADGGGVYIADQGVFNLYDGSAVNANYVATGKNGAGIYVNEHSLLQLSDVVNITGNQQISGSKASEGVDNNVYLSTYNSKVNVGTADTDDPFTKLLGEAKVGITKNPDWGDYWYAPVAYSDGGQGYLGELIGSGVMWDDQTKYELVSLNNTHLNPPTDYLYFVGTWVTEVTENPQNPSEPNTFDLTQIDTPYELAWLISYVNGLNGASKHPEAVATLTDDIDMSANIWVPITNFTGTFNGNGHVVTGLRSPLNNENMGMFGVTTDAHITDLVAQANFAGGTMKNVGTIIGTMNGGVLSNVESAGTLTGTNTTSNIGGLVGNATSNAVIHSAFAVNTMTGGTNTVMGGLVGTNAANLYNSYSNVTMNGGATVGGLVGQNDGTIENCYNATETDFAFAGINNGSIKFSYAAENSTYVGTSGDEAELTGHGIYDEVKGRKELGYMYDDNAVTAENDYVADTITYADGRIATWPGLLSTLNQWVADHEGYTPWFRSTSGDINGDLPILGFPKDNSLATEDGKFLFYGSNVNANGLDNLFETYAEKEANMFLYGNATNVTMGNGDNMLFINEDAVLIQSSTEAINATVGVTFDNSDHGQNATDWLGHELGYDWHMMSTPLSDAAFGATYGTENGHYGDVNITKMEGGYFPDGLSVTTPAPEGTVMWDFYTYYEPEYHWINFKRTDHWHVDNANQIQYNEADQRDGIFTPGKGYMMAISQDSYMSSTGTLNNGDVTIALTNQEPEGINFNKGWNLVGNPYQAYLDLTALGQAGFNAYAYDADNGVYVPFVMGSSENPATLADCIHPHQAFFLYAVSNSVTFKPEMATAEKTDNSYFRDAKVNYPLVNIFAENERGNRDMTIIEFNRPEIGGATEIQGLRNANFHIAAHLDGQGYGLLFAPEGTDRVPVRFYTEEDGTFTLTWETMHGDFTSLLLVDNMTGTITDMLRADHYTFDATTDDYASRFYITFAVTDVEEYNEGDNDFAWFDGSEWVVNGKGTLDVVDVLGRTVYSARLTDEQNRVNLNNVAKGVYMLRVSQGTSTKVQKVVVR